MLQDFVADMRPFAQDPQAYDDFVKQWFSKWSCRSTSSTMCNANSWNDQQWEVTARLTNIGTGRMPVDVAATTGDRFDDKAQPRPEYRDQRTHVTLGKGEQAEDHDPLRLRAATARRRPRPTGAATQTQTVTVQLLISRQLHLPSAGCDSVLKVSVVRVAPRRTNGCRLPGVCHTAASSD